MPSIDRKQLDAKVDDIFDQVVAWRRHLHQHPELSFHETQTAAYIEGELKKLDPEGKHLTITRPVPNGLWADLKGTRSGGSSGDKIILLRADTDALPVPEESDVDFKSKTAGVSHACGHDCHTAMLLGAVKLLLAEAEFISGTVRFLFQPAEELNPGGMKTMLAVGCAEGVSMAFGEHVFPISFGPTGSIAMREGVMFCSSDSYTIRIIGNGGHASMPELAVDPVAVSALVITALQSMVTRRLPSNEAPVLTITAIHSASDAFNVIGDDVTMKGTLRCSNAEVREKARKYLEEVLAGITQSAGARYELDFEDGYALGVNDKNAYAVGERAAKAVLPSTDNIVYMPAPMKGSEDFSFLAERVPSNYVGIGSFNPSEGCCVANHHPKFKIDEQCFKVGVKLHYGVVHDLLMS